MASNKPFINFSELETSTIFNCEFCGKPPWDENGKIVIVPWRPCCEAYREDMRLRDLEAKKANEEWLSRATQELD